MSSKSDSKPAETPSPIGEISQEPSALESFLDANQKKLVIVGILAILVLIGYVVVDGLKEMTRRDNAAAVAAARTVPEYEKVSEELAGETAGGSALLLKSKLLWKDQQQQEAIETLNKFISDYPEHPAIGSAYASLGSYQQQLGNLTEAKKAFQDSVETKSAASSLSLLALGDLAREAGNNDEAKTFYDRIITEYEDSHFQVKGLARERIELIGVKSPTEKAPEPIQPNPAVNPGAFTPPAGFPDVSPKPSPLLRPDDQPSEEDPSAEGSGDEPAGGDTPAADPAPAAETTEEQPAGEDPAEAGEAPATETTETAESGPAAPEPAPAGTDGTAPVE